MDSNISVVIPTYNRAEKVGLVIQRFLEFQEICKIIVVDDCSDDITESVISNLNDPLRKIEYHRLEKNYGSAKARNYGLSCVKSSLVFITDDDIFITEDDYFVKLSACMREKDADVVAGRLILLKSLEDFDQGFKRVEKNFANRPYIEAHFGINVQKNSRDYIDSYLLPPVMLLKSKLTCTVLYDENYPVNAWREETDFQIRLKEQGSRLVFCPFAFAYHLYWKSKVIGGNRSAKRLNYELWVFKNNIRFAVKNRSFLRNYLNLQIPPIILAVYWTFYRFYKLILVRLLNL